MGKRVVLAMSGGVDSSAAAVLLQQQGYDVIGLFMRSGATEETVCKTAPIAGSPSANGPSLATAADSLPESGLLSLPVVTPKAHKQGCCSASDAADARRVADALDIPFHALNFKDAFGRIKDYFADEYLAGRTPNPCVMCNNWLKFGKLWDFAVQVGAEAIATGHYARIVRGPSGEPQLIRGRDRSKDQSYVLFGIDPQLLDRILFPVGDDEKPAIRELAAQAGLRVATKPDSQEICFVPDNDYAGFLQRYRGVNSTAGEFVDPQGRVLGTHPGFERFTIGQRRGLGITFGEPRFVIRIEPETRRVVLGTKDDLLCRGLEGDRWNWMLRAKPTEPLRCRAQIRYQHQAAEAVAVPLGGDRWRVDFVEPQAGVAPGQAVVLYDGDRVMGGGWIARGLPMETEATTFESSVASPLVGANPAPDRASASLP